MSLLGDAVEGEESGELELSSLCFLPDCHAIIPNPDAHLPSLCSRPMKTHCTVSFHVVQRVNDRALWRMSRYVRSPHLMPMIDLIDPSVSRVAPLDPC